MKANRLFLMGLVVLITMLGSIVVNAQPQKGRAALADPRVTQPALSEYKGVRLGMTAQEARAKLGQPAVKGDDQDYFVFSETETAQVAYDQGHKVVTISIDYFNGVGAPDSQSVVGDIQPRPDGSLYKIVRRQSEGFWVSYSRTAGTVPMVTITIQKI